MTPLGKYMTASMPTDSNSGKTKIWRILDREGGALGTVRWFSRWRCYIFEPALDTVFNSTCLLELHTFCGAETTKHLHPTVFRKLEEGSKNLGAEVRALAALVPESNNG